MEFIEVAELKALLRRAYEEGNKGYLGMRDEVVEQIATEFKSSKNSAPAPSFTMTTNMNLQENIVSPYYLYSTMTLPPPEIGRRDEVV